MTTQQFEFTSNEHRLSGFVDTPVGGRATAMIVSFTVMAEQMLLDRLLTMTYAACLLTWASRH